MNDVHGRANRSERKHQLLRSKCDLRRPTDRQVGVTSTRARVGQFRNERERERQNESKTANHVAEYRSTIVSQPVGRRSDNFFVVNWSLESLEKHFLIGSMLIEGSTLTESEATSILAGRMVPGHAVGEIRELLNYRSSVAWLIEQLSGSAFLSVDLILSFHQKLFAGFAVPAGQFKTHRNFTIRSDGTKHAFLAPEQVLEAIRQWVVQFNDDAATSAFEGAARLYASFENIHPFDDGNGRIGRVLIAYWLHWKFRKIFTFYAADKLEHLKAIEATNAGDHSLLAKFFEQRLRDERA
jgi:fido (protein-threonine AMPylation protein)